MYHTMNGRDIHNRDEIIVSVSGIYEFNEAYFQTEVYDRTAGIQRGRYKKVESENMEQRRQKYERVRDARKT